MQRASVPPFCRSGADGDATARGRRIARTAIGGEHGVTCKRSPAAGGELRPANYRNGFLWLGRHPGSNGELRRCALSPKVRGLAADIRDFFSSMQRISTSTPMWQVLSPPLAARLDLRHQRLSVPHPLLWMTYSPPHAARLNVRHAAPPDVPHQKVLTSVTQPLETFLMHLLSLCPSCNRS